MRKQALHPSTSSVNRKQKELSKKFRNEALQWLANNFPHAFDNSISIHPLKIGIMEDVLEHAELAAQSGISKSKLREAVVIYTRRIDYLAALKARNPRIDLQGTKVAPVTAEEAEIAALKIKKWTEISARNAKQLENNLKETHRASPVNKNTLQARERLPRDSFQDVVIKHKHTRPQNSLAVERLKEKLGLQSPLGFNEKSHVS